MRHLKKKALQNLQQLIRKYKSLLGLADWEIEIAISNKDLFRAEGKKVKRIKDVDYYAEVFYTYKTKYATIFLTRLQIEKPKELEDTILHEMLHIRFAHIIQLAESLINVADLSKERTEALLGELDESEHEIVESLTKLFLKQGMKDGK